MFSNPAIEKGIRPLTQAIHLDLRIQMNSQQIKQVMGTPSHEGEFMGGLFLSYNEVRSAVDLTIKLDKTGQTIEFVRFFPSETE